jgi:hypothetical protein
MKAKLQFGKIAYTNNRKENAVDVTIELREKGGEKTFTIDPATKERIYTGNTAPTYTELSICGNIWNRLHTDIYCGGQCLDTMIKYKSLRNNPLFNEIYGYWKKYHLNGCHVGTPEQEQLVREWESEGNRYDYTAACEMLKSKGKYEVLFTGKTIGRMYNNEPYKYGHAWIVNDLPEDVKARIEEIILQNA